MMSARVSDYNDVRHSGYEDSASMYTSSSEGDSEEEYCPRPSFSDGDEDEEVPIIVPSDSEHSVADDYELEPVSKRMLMHKQKRQEPTGPM